MNNFKAKMRSFIARRKRRKQGSPLKKYSDLQIENLREEVENLVDLCLASADKNVLNKIIDDHTECITGSGLCEKCNFLYYETDEELPILILARNSNLEFKDHSKLYSITFNWQGMKCDYISNLLLNSQLEKRTRKLICKHFTELLAFETLPDIYQVMLDHPDFEQPELKQLLKELDGYVFTEDMQLMYDSKFS